MTTVTRWEPFRQLLTIPFRQLLTMQEQMNRMNPLFRGSYIPEGPEEALTTTTFATRGYLRGRAQHYPEDGSPGHRRKRH